MADINRPDIGFGAMQAMDLVDDASNTQLKELERVLEASLNISRDRGAPDIVGLSVVQGVLTATIYRWLRNGD